MRKVFAIAAILLGALVIFSSPLRHVLGQAPKAAGPVARPVVPAAERNVEKELAASKFEQGGIITYKPLQGETLFAMQLKPQLPAVPVRKRDILILICNSAAQAGEPGIAATQIAEAIIDTAGPDDRISLWTYSTPDQTKPLFKDFLFAKDDKKRLTKAIADLKSKDWPGGDSDLKTALENAVKSFEGSDTRQRILLYLGDGQSMHNPTEAADRHALISEMVKKRIAFYPVPLGLGFNPENLHGIATGTGGTVLRTAITQEKLADAMKRYQQAFAGAILYDAQLKMPAGVTQFFPKNLPPLRGDVPTLVVGRLQNAKSLTYTLNGTVAGRPGNVNLEATEKIPEPELDNYFLASMIRQWDKAQTQPAIVHGADRLLAMAYSRTRGRFMTK